ncbi:hypothetical protein [Actinophytocola sp.]|uniref:hypothetical protein n=1 Tax=Actinophytocola sp. TaxID=1872138 RepID=UPI002D7FFC41|nr:hypothetical protein [Actinophytocola sp.]HET9144090.1 hypothetical protein [Actinophytocola sp.]
MTDTRAFDDDRTTGPLRSCGRCTNGEGETVLKFDCPVHGRLAEWAADNADPKIVEKVADAASSHERAAAAWGEITGAVADVFETFAGKLRGRGDR